MRGTVSRFIGAGVGLARLVLVSSWNVVDMSADLASEGSKGKVEEITLGLGASAKSLQIEVTTGMRARGSAI